MLVVGIYSMSEAQSCADNPLIKNGLYTKYLRVNFHFILDNNNEGNFSPDDDGL